MRYCENGKWKNKTTPNLNVTKTLRKERWAGNSNLKSINSKEGIDNMMIFIRRRLIPLIFNDDNGYNSWDNTFRRKFLKSCKDCTKEKQSDKYNPKKPVNTLLFDDQVIVVKVSIYMNLKSLLIYNISQANKFYLYYIIVMTNTMMIFSNQSDNYLYGKQFFNSSLQLKVYIENDSNNNWECIGVTPSKTPIKINPCSLWLVEPIGAFQLNNDWKMLVEKLSKDLIPGLILPEKIRDKHLKLLVNLTNLDTLFMRDSYGITEKGLSYIARLKGLKRFYYLSCEKMFDNYLWFESRSIYDYMSYELSINKKQNKVIDGKILQYISSLKNLEVLNLSIEELNDNKLREITKLQKLKHLTIYRNNSISNEGLRIISNLKDLEILTIAGEKLTDEGLKYLSDLKELRRLNLYCCENFTDSGFQYISDISGLEELLIGDYIELTDFGFKRILNLKRLRNLTIYDPRYLTERSFECLTNLPNLTKLIFYTGNHQYNDINSLAIKYIGKCSELKKLLLTPSPNTLNSCTKVDFAYLSQLKNLESAFLTNFVFSINDFLVFHNLPMLRELLIYNSKVDFTRKDLGKIYKLHRLSSFGTDWTSLSLIKKIVSVEKLKHIYLDNATASPELLQWLVSAKNLESIYCEELPASLEYLSEFNNLKEVYDLYCVEKREKEINNLTQLKNLERISVKGYLEYLPFLSKLVEIEVHNIYSDDLKYISNQRRLQKIKLSGTFSTTNYNKNDWLFLKKLNHLEEIDLTSCSIPDNVLKDLNNFRNSYLQCCRIKPRARLINMEDRQTKQSIITYTLLLLFVIGLFVSIFIMLKLKKKYNGIH